MSILVYDIETAGVHEADPKGGLPSAAKQFNGLGEILISCISVVDPKFPKDIKSFCGADEKKLLTDFWDFVNTKFSDPSKHKMVAYNNNNFDDRVLTFRSIVHSTGGFPLYAYGNSIDLKPIALSASRALYGKDNFTKGHLGDLCVLLGIEVPFGDGSEAPAAYHRGDFEYIREHCESDVRATLELYNRLEKFI